MPLVFLNARTSVSATTKVALGSDRPISETMDDPPPPNPMTLILALKNDPICTSSMGGSEIFLSSEDFFSEWVFDFFFADGDCLTATPFLPAGAFTALRLVTAVDFFVGFLAKTFRSANRFVGKFFLEMFFFRGCFF